MANKVCITPEQEIKLKQAVANGEFSLEKIKATKSSAERVELVQKYLGEGETSKKVVREIEKRIESQKETIVEDYIKRTFTSVPEETRKGVLNRYKRMLPQLGAKEEQEFMEELVSHKFGAYITREEANKFEQLTNEAIVLKEEIPTSATEVTPQSLKYGEKIVELENIESRILLERTGFNIQDYKKISGQTGKEAVASWSKYVAEGTIEGSAATRSFLASADFSATLRQLWKLFSSGVLDTTVSFGKDTDKLKIWWRATAAGWDAFKSAGKYNDARAYDAIRAKIHADPNSYMGVYDASKNGYAMRVKSEEQFPSSVPSDLFEKLSKKGNIFKMSEVAFNATILHARYELANLTIKTLKDGGANVMDKEIATAAGEFVSAFTGRGGLGDAESFAKQLNKIFFAPKFAASQFSPYYQILKGITTKADNPAARLAAKENVKFLMGSAALMTMAVFLKSALSEEEADYTASLNPMSNRFGKVTFPGTDIAIDFTGGNRAVMNLFTAMFTKTYYDSRLQTWREKNIMQLSDGKPIYDFVTSKYAPVPSMLRDLKRGEHFGGGEVSVGTIASKLLIPITVQNVWEEAVTKDGDLSTAMVVLLAEGIGMSASDIRFKPQNDEWKALLNTDEKAYWKAVDELWKGVHFKAKIFRNNEAFQSLPRKEQTKRLEEMYRRELDRVISQKEYYQTSKDKLKEIKDKREE
jgi:hypothetical protein